jgi:hypothetical protein
MGGRVHRDQPLGAVQEERAGQDREQDETRAERGAAVDPGGRAQAVGWGRRWRLGVQAGQGRRSVGWSSVGGRCLIRAYPIKGVISDTF